MNSFGYYNLSLVLSRAPQFSHVICMFGTSPHNLLRNLFHNAASQEIGVIYQIYQSFSSVFLL